MHDLKAAALLWSAYKSSELPRLTRPISCLETPVTAAPTPVAISQVLNVCMSQLMVEWGM